MPQPFDPSPIRCSVRAPAGRYPAQVETLGWLAFGTAMILVVLHRTAARRYLDAYQAAHGSRDPGTGWVIHADPVPLVEDLRRRRLLLVLPASLLVMTGIVLVVFVS
jgi:hypothetical protein